MRFATRIKVDIKMSSDLCMLPFLLCKLSCWILFVCTLVKILEKMMRKFSLEVWQLVTSALDYHWSSHQLSCVGISCAEEMDSSDIVPKCVELISCEVEWLFLRRCSGSCTSRSWASKCELIFPLPRPCRRLRRQLHGLEGWACEVAEFA